MISAETTSYNSHVANIAYLDGAGSSIGTIQCTCSNSIGNPANITVCLIVTAHSLLTFSSIAFITVTHLDTVDG